MIEIGLALAAASKAFELIKQGVEAGQDATDLIGQIGSFYDAKEKVQEAKEEVDRQKAKGIYASGSVENYALKVIESEMKIAKMEEAVRRIFVDKGKTPQYKRMMRLREEERYRRNQQQIKDNRLKREKLRKEQDFKNLMFAILAATFCVGGLGWIITFIGSL